MHRLKGIAISPGYTEGVAVVYDYEMDYRLEFPDRVILQSEIGAEHGRLDDATRFPHAPLPPNAVVVARELPPSEMVELT
jgi:phosphoenolpyruvate-protein kinase (PTS system EI component)